MMKAFLFLCTFLLAPAASAQTFDVILGGKILGQLSYIEEGRKATLRSTLNSTPMGVFNGTFTGTSTSAGRFTGDSRSSRKQRVVTVDIKKGRAHSVEVTPAKEMTDLSDITRVPAGVVDPVRAVGSFITASGCPSGMRMYDGRRVVALGPQAGSREGDTLTCPFSYKVIAGPGHLSPLRISNAKMQLIYHTSGTAQSLREIRISSGIFRLSLLRRD